MDIIIGCLGLIGLIGCKKMYNQKRNNRNNEKIIDIDKDNVNELSKGDENDKLIELTVNDGYIQIGSLYYKNFNNWKNLKPLHNYLAKIIKSDFLEKYIKITDDIKIEITPKKVKSFNNFTRNIPHVCVCKYCSYNVLHISPDSVCSNNENIVYTDLDKQIIYNKNKPIIYKYNNFKNGAKIYMSCDVSNDAINCKYITDDKKLLLNYKYDVTPIIFVSIVSCACVMFSISKLLYKL